MDPIALAGMILSLLLVMMIGGFILLVPLSRRLAAVLEQRLREKRGDPADADGIEALRAAVRSLEAEVQALVERQAFVDSLLAARETPRVPAAANSQSNAIEPGSRAPAATHAPATPDPEPHHG